MSNLESIRKPILGELNIFEEKFKASMQSSVPLLDRVTHYIVKRNGKQMRPMFVLLSAKLCGGINESTYRGAALVELLHTASLVHDDVVDNAYQRRGFFSINALWKNKIAVLVGDFLLAKGLLLSVNHEDFQLLKIVSEAVRQMSEGELLQMEKARRMDVDEELYYQVIKQKTASLIASCCACGAASAGASQTVVENMRLLGEKIGIAFQIKDDIFDFGSDDIGKPKGIDIKEKKITLPLIYALQQTNQAQKRQIINWIKNDYDDQSKVDAVVQFVRDSGGIAYANKVMLEWQKEAFGILDQFDDCEAKDGLKQLIKFTIERNK